MHISYIIDILYNWTDFMSNISFIFKFIMDWMNKDDILKKKVFTKVFKKYLNTSMYLVFKYICKKYLVLSI